ncbi:MAG: hypothetical protein ABIJ95_11360 [Pseudomonadota bacterium]
MADVHVPDLKSSDADPKVTEVYRLLRVYAADKDRKAWLSRRDEAWKAMGNEMWTDSEKESIRKQGQEPLVFNLINKGVQGSCAIVTDQKPEVSFLPIGSGDLYIAELLKRAHDVVWNKNAGSDTTYDCVEEAKVGGLGWIEARFDETLGPFGSNVFTSEDPEAVYFDAKSRARDFSDTPIIKAVLRPRSWAKDFYPEIKPEDLFIQTTDAELKGGTSSGLTGQDNYAAGERRDSTERPDEEPLEVWEIAAYMLKVREVRVIRIPLEGEPGGMQVLRVPDDVEDVDAYAARFPGATVKTYRKERRVLRYIVGKKLVEEKDNPFGEDAEGNSVCPLIPLRAQRTRTAYPMAPVTYALPINRERNKRRLQFSFAVSQNNNAPIMEPTGMVKWVGPDGTPGVPGTPGTRGQYTNTLAPGAVYRLTPGTFDASKFLQLEGQAVQDVNDQFDMHDVMKGKVPQGQSGASGRMILALQDMGGMMSKPFLRRLESTLVSLAKVNVGLILKHWTIANWMRLLEDEEMATMAPEEPTGRIPQDSAEMRQTQRNKWLEAIEKIRPLDENMPPAISLLDLDVRMVAGSSAPTNRIARMQAAIELTQAGIYDAEAALQYIDDPEKDRIVQRLKAKEEAMMQAEMMKKAGA